MEQPEGEVVYLRGHITFGTITSNYQSCCYQPSV